MGGLFAKLLSTFYTRKLEAVLVGLENAGKTTLLNILANGESVETCPTIGLNVKLVKKGGVAMKCWDIGGQAQYRGEWGRYVRGCDCIIFVVDTHARDSLKLARYELHRLLEDRELSRTPILVCANKIDLTPHVEEPELIRALNLDYIVDNPWIVISISALRTLNVDKVVSWLVKHSK